MKKNFLLVILAVLVVCLLHPVYCFGDWLKQNDNGVFNVKFSKDDDYIYAFTKKGIEKRSVLNGDFISYLDGYTGIFYNSCISSDCKKGASIISDSILIWDFEKERIQYKISSKDIDPGFSYRGIEISPDGKFLYLTDFKRVDSTNLLVFNIKDKKVEKLLNLEGAHFQIKLSPDGKYLITRSYINNGINQLIMLWDAETMTTLYEIERGNYRMGDLNFSYDSKLIVYCTGNVLIDPFNVFIIIYDIDLKTYKRFPMHNLFDDIIGMANCISRDNKFLIVGFERQGEGATRVYSIENGKWLNDIPFMDALSYDLSQDNTKLVMFGLHTFNKNGKYYNAPRIELLDIDFNVFSVRETPSGSKTFSLNQAEGKLNILLRDAGINGICGIYNTYGNLLQKQNLNLNEGTASIDISSLVSGAYFCRIICGGNVFTEGFVVVK